MFTFHKLALACALSAAISMTLPAVAHAQYWRGTWGASPQMPLSKVSNVPVTNFKNKTIRQVVHISSGGDRIRLRLSNELSNQDNVIGNITVAIAEPGGKVRRATMRDVTFGGLKGVTLSTGAPMLSDPIDLKVGDGANIAITLYFPNNATELTAHTSAYATAWVLDSNRAYSEDFSAGQTFMRRLVISGVEVENAQKSPVIVTLGDSITDGTATTTDANLRWPDRLAERFRLAGQGKVGIVNAGIGANRVLRTDSSPSALARFDRDVLSVAGASHLIVLEGVNDLGNMKREGYAVSSRDMIDGYRQIIRRAKTHDLKVYLATIVPYKGAGYWSEEGEQVRKEVNAWIRTQREASGFFDFDRAIANPKDTDYMAKGFDSGDALHPNDAGMQALANAVHLNAF